MVRHLAGLDEIALDTEGDSLHHYPERLALIQISDRADQAWLVDPLALAADQLAERPQVVLHAGDNDRSEEHTSELQSRGHLVCRLLLEKKNPVVRHNRNG